VLIVAWTPDADLQAFIDTQRAAGVVVEVAALTTADQPPWDDPVQFENQALPRRSLVQLATLLTERRA
jgi:hypothetical protein